MKSSVFNSNGSKHINILVALIIVFLLLQGQVITQKESKVIIVGHGQHSLERERVTLAEGSKVATKEDIDNYKAKFPDACDVDFDENGDIVLHYKKEGSVAKNGCTVDLLTSLEDKFLFKTGVSNAQGLQDCVTTDVNENVLPFVYSRSNERFKEFHSGPEYIKKEVCQNTRCPHCIGQTGLEVGWVIESPNIRIIANPIGTRQIRSLLTSMEEMEKNKKYPMMTIINGEKERYIYNYSNSEVASENSICMLHEVESILSPKAWKIVDKSPDPEKKYLLVFHLLPQTATKTKVRMDGYFAIGENSPNGPKCDDLQIKFIGKDYALVISDRSIPVATTPLQPNNFTTTSTAKGDKSDSSTSSIDEETTIDQDLEKNISSTSSTLLGASKTISSPKTNSTTSKTISTTAASKSSSNTVWIIIIIVVLVFVVVVGIIIYFVMKNSNKKEKDAEEGVEKKGDVVEGGKEKKEGVEEKKEGEEKKEEEDDEGEKSKEKEDGEKSKEEEEGDEKKGSESKEGETKEGETKEGGATSANTEEKEEGEEKKETEKLTPEEEAQKKEEDEIYKA